MIESIDVDKELRTIENCLRDIIIYVLSEKYNDNYKEKFGVSKERLQQWKQRQEEEKKRLNGKNLDDRIIYYADFYDLKTIINKNWECFKEVFSNNNKINYMLETLEKYRNPNAHNRDLMEYQKHLLIGIGGELIMNIMDYKSKKENEDKYFPKLISCQINGKPYKDIGSKFLGIKEVFHFEDFIEIKLFSQVPPGYNVKHNTIINNKYSIKDLENDKILLKLDNRFKIGNNSINITIKSNQDFHRNNGYDDFVNFSLMILPSVISNNGDYNG